LARTLDLKIDAHGLWGSILINPNDQDALNEYARTQRGDVNQCSFGFDILGEDTEVNAENGSVHWVIRKVKLYEVSVCTFPAYKTTEVSARSKDLAEIRRKSLEAWKLRAIEKLKGAKN
jgi:HK97 family phage prohead protease